MMNCFPQIYEDELFYSIVARYKRMCGFISKSAVLYDLYDEVIGLESINFPLHIERVISNLPPSSKITSEYIIKNNTMFRLYTAFLSQEESKLVFEKMKSSKDFQVSQSIGLMSSKIKMYKHLKYCKLCRYENMKMLGESYWSRLFQVPGVLFCPKHRVQLKNSSVFTGNSRLEYICADQKNILREDVDDDISRHMEINLKYIEMVKYLLDNDVDRKKLRYIIDFYIDKLRQRGLASKGGSLHIDELQSTFIDYYGNDYLELMQSGVDINKEANWLKIFVRDNGKNRNVLRHILLLQFLNVDIKELFSGIAVKGRFKMQIKYNSNVDIDIRRAKWLEFLKDNRGKSKSELNKTSKGLSLWLYRNDNEWFNKITPKREKLNADNVLDWGLLDKNTLILVKKAVVEILNLDGKPKQLSNALIRRYLEKSYSFNSKKLIKTRRYIKRLVEDIDSYRIRKVKWAIQELISRDERVTRFKIQLVAGFGSSCDSYIKNLIDKVLE